jgi:hypothetical protein
VGSADVAGRGRTGTDAVGKRGLAFQDRCLQPLGHHAGLWNFPLWNFLSNTTLPPSHRVEPTDTGGAKGAGSAACVCIALQPLHEMSLQDERAALQRSVRLSGLTL